MERVTVRQPIAEALALLTPRLRERCRCHWLTGVDPGFVGFHPWQETDGYPLSSTAHCVWEYHQAHLPVRDRVPTIVLPRETTIEVVLHELGHVLEAAIRWDYPRAAAPVTAYAETSTWEAFAEAFSLWVAPEHFLPWNADARPDVLAADESTLALFAELAA